MSRRLNFVQHTPLTWRQPLPRRACAQTRMTAATTASHTLDGKDISGPIQPAGQNILVRVAEAAEKTAGGLILTAGAKEKPTYGEAVEVGRGRYYANGVLVPMQVSKGDTVLYGKYGGTDLVYDGEKHCMVTQDDILCKLRDGVYAADAVDPIYDRVLVKLEEPDESTASGIIISKTTKEKPTRGRVVAMGPGRLMENGEMEPLDFGVGDVVLYGKYAGTNVEFDDDDYVLIRVADVFAKI